MMKNYFTTQSILLRFTLITSLVGSTMLSTANLAHADSPHNRVDSHTQIAQTDPWTAQVRNQLLQAAKAAGWEGLQLTHEPFIDNLGNGGEDDITVNLKTGVSYTIIGVCDEDCGDIDLGLYDDNGNLVSSDTGEDDVPVITITPGWNARFTIRVVMAECSNGPCRYGVGAFGK
jgi:hypothetical protein